MFIPHGEETSGDFWVTNFVRRSGHLSLTESKSQKQKPEGVSFDVTHLKVQILHNFPLHKQGTVFPSSLLVAETSICIRRQKLCVAWAWPCFTVPYSLSSVTHPLSLKLYKHLATSAPLEAGIRDRHKAENPNLFHIWKGYLKLRQYLNFAEVQVICPFASLPNLGDDDGNDESSSSS